MAQKFTPMMEQYFEIKKQYEDCILMYRLGDFYEMFFDDAHKASKALGLTLTGRDCGQEERAPMCGVPFHAANTYISKLVAQGYKVAICEQMEDPALAKGIVKRDVIRIITPGTIVDDNVVGSQSSNYLCGIYAGKGKTGLSFVDLSTGELASTLIENDPDCGLLFSELARFAPVEVTLNEDAFANANLIAFLNERISALSFTYKNDALSDREIASVFAGQFGNRYDNVLDDIEQKISIAILLSYLKETQKVDLTHIEEIRLYQSDQYMSVDAASLRNLEIVETMRDKKKRGSLFGVLDKTETSMGARTLKKWLLRPLVNIGQITDRLNAVEELTSDMQVREELSYALRNVHDIERLMGKIAIQTANARDLIALRDSFCALPELKSWMQKLRSDLLARHCQNLDTLEDVTDLLMRSISDDPPISLRDGGLIKDGFHEEIDTLRRAKKEGTGWLSQIEAEEREKTGIKNLKVGFNKVFGYYIEVSNSYKDKVPESYIRKQTLTNGERYITPRLKEIEDMVLGADERVKALEYQLFVEIREQVKGEIERIRRTAGAIANTDALLSLAKAAVKNHYTKPIVNASGNITIRDGRHPVVEQALKESLFVPNDTAMNRSDQMLTIITGPNMAGKSTYMRQVALISLMAQAGSFVPAGEAELGLVDRIFTRVGASDDLAAGQSTFMVEMSEVANILRHATDQSLVILDEIGRGTSTYDGLSIAWAVVEHMVKKVKCKTLFATHYHELTTLEETLPGVINFRVAVKKRGDDITFLRKIIRGGADESYGVEVAKLAGVPLTVINKAKEILASLESGEPRSKAVQSQPEEEDAQIGFADFARQEIIEELCDLEVTALTPIEAMNKLYELQNKAKGM